MDKSTNKFKLKVPHSTWNENGSIILLDNYCNRTYIL